MRPTVHIATLPLQRLILTELQQTTTESNHYIDNLASHLKPQHIFRRIDIDYSKIQLTWSVIRQVEKQRYATLPVVADESVLAKIPNSTIIKMTMMAARNSTHRALALVHLHGCHHGLITLIGKKITLPSAAMR